LFFFSIILTLTFIETFLYIDNYREDYKRHKKVINSFEYTTNDEILYTFNKENNFIILGDSFTYGEVCASKNKDFTSLLTKEYENCNFYNYGINAGNPIHYINILNNLELDNIKKILVVLYYNDINLTVRNCKLYKKLENIIYYFPKKCLDIIESNIDTQNDTILKKIDNFFERKVLIWPLLKESLANAPYFNKYYNRSSWKSKFEDPSSQEFLSLINDLKYIKDISIKNNIELIITYFPDVHYVKEDFSRSYTWNKFIKEATKFDIKILNPWKFFLSNSENTNMTWSLVDKHPNCKAHKIMADYLIRSL